MLPHSGHKIIRSKLVGPNFLVRGRERDCPGIIVWTGYSCAGKHGQVESSDVWDLGRGVWRMAYGGSLYLSFVTWLSGGNIETE